MQRRASVSLCFVGDSQRTFHFACSIALLQLSSDSALFMSWLPGFSETGTWAARWHSLRQVVWDVAGGCTLLWASTMTTDRRPGSCDVVDAVSCPHLLELLTPGRLGQGTGRPTSTPGHWLLDWENLCVSIWHQPYLQVWLLEHWARCTSRYPDVQSCIITSRGRLGNHVPLKQGHVLLGWGTSAMNVALFCSKDLSL